MTQVTTETSPVQQLRLQQHKGNGASLGSSPPRTAGPAPAQRDLRSLKRAERLALIPGVLASRFPADQLALVQVWTSCTPVSGWTGVAKAAGSAVVFRTQPMGAHMSDSALAPFRASSCESGISRSAVGMLGKVWSSGALAVVQNVAIIPTSVHPRNKLDDAMAERVSELAYIPVYDLRQPEAGVVACLEVMMSAFATSALVANVISHSCDLLTQFQLSLGKPSSNPAAPVPAPSPFAVAAAQMPPPSIPTQAAFRATAPVLDRSSAPACLPDGRTHSGGVLPLRPLRPVPGTATRSVSGGSSSSGASPLGSGGSSPTSPGTPVLGAPPARITRTMSSMQRSTSIRRLDSLADLMQH